MLKPISSLQIRETKLLEKSHQNMTTRLKQMQAKGRIQDTQVQPSMLVFQGTLRCVNKYWAKQESLFINKGHLRGIRIFMERKSHQ